MERAAVQVMNGFIVSIYKNYSHSFILFVIIGKLFVIHFSYYVF